MKKNLFYPVVVILLIAIISSCKKKETEDESSSPNFTFTIRNHPSAPSASQFTYLELTPTDASSPTKGYSFVLDNQLTISVKAKIPKTGFYKLQIFVAKNGKSIWWNSIALEKDGGTYVHLWVMPVLGWAGSTCGGINADGSDMP